MNPSTSIEWQAPEYVHYPKDQSWFWRVGVVGFIFLIVAVLLKNFLFAIIALLGTFTVVMYGARAPEMTTFALTPKGIRVRNRLYPYDNLHSFWVHDERHPNKIIVESEHTFLPHMVIPLPPEITHEQAREYLLQYLPEVRHEESLVDIIWENLGF